MKDRLISEAKWKLSQITHYERSNRRLESQFAAMDLKQIADELLTLLQDGRNDEVISERSS